MVSTPSAALPIREVAAPKGLLDEGRANGLLKTFHERRLVVSTMDRPLRLATAGAVASLLGAVVLIAIRDVGTSSVVTGVNSGVNTTLSGALFVATLILLSLGFGYLMTGAVLAHRVVAFASVLVMTVLMGWQTGTLGIGGVRAFVPGWAHLTTRLLLGAIWLVAIIAIALRRGRDGDDDRDRGLRLIVLAAYCSIFGGYFFVLWLATPTQFGLNLFPESVALVMVDVALLSIPMLMIAAVDFGEWGEITGRRFAESARSAPESVATRRRRWLVPSVASAVLIGAGWFRFSHSPGTLHRFGVMGEALLVLSVGLLILFAFGRVLHVSRIRWPATLGFSGLFVVAMATAWIIGPLVATVTGALSASPSPSISSQGNFTAAANVRSLTGSSSYTVLVPLGWQVKTSKGIDSYVDFDPQDGLLQMYVVEQRQSTPFSIAAEAALLHVIPTGHVQTDGSFTKLPIRTAQGSSGAIWMQRIRGRAGPVVVFVGEVDANLVKGATPSGGLRQLEAVVRSFRPAGSPPAHTPVGAAIITTADAAQVNADRVQAWAAGIGILASLIAIGLIAANRRRLSARVQAAMLLFGVVALFRVLYFGDSIARVAFGPRTHWPTMSSVGGLLMAIGVLSLVALAVACRRAERWAGRVPVAITGLIGGVLVLDLMDVLYNHALSESRIAGWAAVVVLVAVAWDVTMSGDSMTNHASKYAPRSSRVFAYFGYVIVLAAAIVFYAGQRSASTGAVLGVPFFEPEALTQGALYVLALPLLLTFFMLRTFGADSTPVNRTGHSVPPHAQTELRVDAP